VGVLAAAALPPPPACCGNLCIEATFVAAGDGESPVGCTKALPGETGPPGVDMPPGVRKPCTGPEATAPRPPGVPKPCSDAPAGAILPDDIDGVIGILLAPGACMGLLTLSPATWPPGTGAPATGGGTPRTGVDMFRTGLSVLGEVTVMCPPCCTMPGGMPPGEP